MGNGYPVAAVIARQELFDRLKEETEVFSTFGGNPVAARAALAVLDVIEDERLIENARRVGEELISALLDLDIGEVRGRGLLVGVELESAGASGGGREPHAGRRRPHQPHGPAGQRPEDPPTARLRERTRRAAHRSARRASRAH